MVMSLVSLWLLVMVGSMTAVQSPEKNRTSIRTLEQLQQSFNALNQTQQIAVLKKARRALSALHRDDASRKQPPNHHLLGWNPPLTIAQIEYSSSQLFPLTDGFKTKYCGGETEVCDYSEGLVCCQGLFCNMTLNWPRCESGPDPALSDALKAGLTHVPSESMWDDTVANDANNANALQTAWVYDLMARGYTRDYSLGIFKLYQEDKSGGKSKFLDDVSRIGKALAKDIAIIWEYLPDDE